MKQSTRAVVAALFALVLAACAIERASPGPTPTGALCVHDGAYELINCGGYAHE